MIRKALLLAALAAAACSDASSSDAAPAPQPAEGIAIVAGGCFWCTEADFEKLPGVASAASGYTGGRTERPTYKQVTAGGTGHYEAVRIAFDPKRVSYAALVRHYFRTVDPTDAGGQFCDRGESYRTAVFVRTPAERRIAEAEKARAARELGRAIVTPILPAGRFWFAEGYHQDYYKKHSIKYRFYRSRCGRDARLAKLWGSKG